MNQLINTKDAEILLYATDNGAVKVDVLFHEESFWMSQKKMADLFDVKQPAISKHLKNIFESNELIENSVHSILEYTAPDGKNYKTQYYNLDAIIAVGYRVNSRQATQFRIWATQTLKEFITKGFVMDDERLKQGKQFGKDYFDELLERIREIRASERRFYQKITDIYAQCSADYDASSETTKQFYSTVQNKLHWAIHGNTAAELIVNRVDSAKPFMGLTNWKNSPKGKVLKSDVSIAKNYLQESEIDELNLVTVMYLDYAELQAKKQRLMKMSDWVGKLDAFLSFNDYELLVGSGKVSAKVAKALAEKEYEVFRIGQDKQHQSDFDRLLEEMKEPKGC